MALFCARLQVFGASVQSGGGPMVSSTKGATGHLLGAAGAVEAAFTVLAVCNRVCPPSINLEEPDGDGPGARFVRLGQRLDLPEFAVSLCNSFGFGGTNTSLLVTSFVP